jgi:hypothetical protein
VKQKRRLKCSYRVFAVINSGILSPSLFDIETNKTTGYDSHPRENHHLHRVENQGYRSQACSHDRPVGWQETVLPPGQELTLPLALPSEQESMLSPVQEPVQELTLLQEQEQGHLPVMTEMET